MSNVTTNGNATSDHMPLPSARDLDIPLTSLIVDESFNSRTNIDGVGNEDAVKVSHLADSMASANQITPILVETRRMGQGKNVTEKYYLISGFRRVAAAKKLGWDTIRARAFEPMSEKQRIYLNLLENTARQDISAYDTAMACSKLVALGETSEQVGLRLGKSDSYIRNLNNSATKLCKLFIDRWRSESSPNFGGKARICTTDKLAKWCQLTPEQQEVEYFSALASKDPKAHAEATGSEGGAKSADGTKQPSAVAPKRPSAVAVKNAVTAMLAKCNAGSIDKPALTVAMNALRWALGVVDTINDGDSTLYNPTVDKLVEGSK